MAGAKKHARRKKRRSKSSPTPTSSSRRPLGRSSSERGSARTASETADRLGVSASTVRRWAASGRLSARRDARGRYVIAKSAEPREAPPRAAKRPPFRKKRGKTSGSRVSRETPPRKKRPGVRAPAPIRARGIKRVASSSSPSLRSAATVFGIAPTRLAELVTEGRVRAVRDAAGVLHIPAAELQARQLALKERRKKRKTQGRAPAVPWQTTPSSKRRKKKKRPSSKLVPKKKKRVRKTKPRRQRFEEAIISDTGPSVHAPPPSAPPPAPSRDAPMEMATAAQKVGDALARFVTARPRWERIASGRSFHDLKVAFKTTYGDKAWRDTYEWIIDDWGLEDLVFDYEALRDS